MEEKWVCNDCKKWFFRHLCLEMCPYCHSIDIEKEKIVKGENENHE